MINEARNRKKKTFEEFVAEAYLIEKTFSSRAELETHYGGVPAGMVANNAASTENPKWRLVTAANRKAQSQRRAENLKPITHKEILSAVKRDLSIPNSEVRSVATKAYNREVSAKGTQTQTRNRLRKETGKRSLPVRKNDTVKITRGSFKGKTGKITKVNRIGMKVFIEKVIRKKSDGTEYNVPIDPSNITIIEIDRSDRKRLKNKKEGKHE